MLYEKENGDHKPDESSPIQFLTSSIAFGFDTLFLQEYNKA